MKVLARILFIIIFTSGCAEKNESSPPSISEKRTFILKPHEAWMNTGVVVHPYTLITIQADEKGMGRAEVKAFDPVPDFGHMGIIAKIGEEGRPFAIGKYKEIQPHADFDGKTLFLGWNNSYMDPEEDLSSYEPVEVKITIEETNAPSLISPEDNIWVSTQNPVFEWEDFNTGVQYVVQISRFDDFRVLEREINTTNSFLDTNTPIIGYPQPQQQEQPVQVAEGVHYWRVRAQLNSCSTLNPCFEWSRWSPHFRLGVELGSPPEKPDIVLPREDTFPSGISVLFEFRQVPDASGTFWRYRIVTSACGEEPEIDPEDPSSGNPSPWRVFQKPNPFPGGRVDVPMMYASFYTPVLSKGEYLVRIEVKDSLENMNQKDYRFSVECE